MMGAMLYRTPAALAALIVIACVACSGGSSHPSTSGSGGASTKAASEAATACRMWSETINKFTAQKSNPDYVTADAMATAIAPLANQASTDDNRWSQLSLDIAGANDFRSAALPDVNNRIAADCSAVPSSIAKTEESAPDPYSTTTTAAPTTTIAGQ
jgi:hypothetical protein